MRAPTPNEALVNVLKTGIDRAGRYAPADIEHAASQLAALLEPEVIE